MAIAKAMVGGQMESDQQMPGTVVHPLRVAELEQQYQQADAAMQRGSTWLLEA